MLHRTRTCQTRTTGLAQDLRRAEADRAVA